MVPLLWHQCCWRGTLTMASVLLMWYPYYGISVADVVPLLWHQCCWRGTLTMASVLLTWYPYYGISVADMVCLMWHWLCWNGPSTMSSVLLTDLLIWQMCCWCYHYQDLCFADTVPSLWLMFCWHSTFTVTYVLLTQYLYYDLCFADTVPSLWHLQQIHLIQHQSSIHCNILHFPIFGGPFPGKWTINAAAMQLHHPHWRTEWKQNGNIQNGNIQNGNIQNGNIQITVFPTMYIGNFYQLFRRPCCLHLSGCQTTMPYLLNIKTIPQIRTLPFTM
jgi:hypothetical protein